MPHFRNSAGIAPAVLLAACTLAACTTTTAPPADVAATDAATPAGNAVPEAPPAVVTSAWTADTLYDLLVGEVAGQRDRLDASLDAYLRQARKLRDPALAERATRIAWYARDTQQIREAATLWADIAPDSPEANANAVMGLIQAGEIEAAEPQLDRLLARDDTAPVRFNFVVQYAQGAEPETRHRLADLLAALSERHAGNARLWLARSALADMDGKPEEALALVQHARAIEPDHPGSIEFEGRLLTATGKTAAARRLLAKGREKFPNERDLRLAYLRVLLAENRGDLARRELTDMLARWPDDGDIALSLALVEWEAGDPASAKQRLTDLAEAGYREDECWNYAGRIALSEHGYEEAAGYFQNVRGAQFLAAQIQVAYAWQKAGRFSDARTLLAGLRKQAPEASTQLFIAESELLARNQDPDGALLLLNEALVRDADDHDLRYARAMAAERSGKLDLVESDLRTIIAALPGNAMALNALGYTLADRTDRLEEARALIEQALALTPDDPAIIDSMGWVLFRMGKPEEAVAWLRRAWTLSPDPEIAAHLGEALWTLGNQREARRIWERARALDPDNAALKRTLERLRP